MTNMKLKIVAELSAETLSRNSKSENASPFWRIMKPNDQIVKKLSFDVSIIQKMRAKEGLDD